MHRVSVTHPIGSLVERELAAGRLTEGLTRKISHQSRYLQPLRHGAKRRATSPYTGEARTARTCGGVRCALAVYQLPSTPNQCVFPVAQGGERKNVCVSEYADIFSYPR